MHRHWTYGDWLNAYGSPDDQQALTFHDCTEARILWPSLAPWIAHTTACERCHVAAAGMQLVPDEVLSCPDCLEAAEFLWTILQDLEHFEPAVARELPRAEGYMEELEGLPLQDQISRVHAEKRYQQWGFCQWLLFKAKDAWHNDPAVAHDRSALAVAVAELLDPAYYHPQWLADLQAKAHAYLANAHRILADFSAAEHHFLVAEHKLRQGVGCLAEARVLSLKASLLIDQYRYTEALAVIDRAQGQHVKREEWHEVGRLCMQRSVVLEALGRPWEAADESSRAAKLLDPSVEPHLVAIAQQNAVAHLIENGHVESARTLFEELPPPGERSVTVTRRGLEGHLLRAECRNAEAIEAYAETRDGWAAMGRYYDAALITMDMALAAYAAGNDQQVATCAEEASVLMVRAAAKHEAFAVLALLFRAIERQTLNRAVLESVRQRLATLQPS